MPVVSLASPDPETAWVQSSSGRFEPRFHSSASMRREGPLLRGEAQGRIPGAKGSVGGSHPPPRCPSVSFTRVFHARDVGRAGPRPAGFGWDRLRSRQSVGPGGFFLHNWEGDSWTGNRRPARSPAREECRWCGSGVPGAGPAGWIRHHPAGPLRWFLGFAWGLHLLQGATRRRRWAGGPPAGHICPSQRERRACVVSHHRSPRPGGWGPQSPPVRAFFRCRVEGSARSNPEEVPHG